MSRTEPTSDRFDIAVAARRLVRSQPTAALATVMADGQPYASLVLAAVDQVGQPILLISGLAEHTKALKGDARCSLLFDGTQGLDSRLTGARVSLVGTAQVTQDAGLKARFLARHADAAGYAGFGDFAFWHMTVERAHLVAGFGRIHWIAGDLYRGQPAPALAAAEADILAHMNEDHADAIALYAQHLAARPAEGWRMTGCDPEGLDLGRGADSVRLDFPFAVTDAPSARKALVALTQDARAKGTP
ncbi:HugZ family protein [Zavarzinia sp. CC-PAN008]|uniref:HugZ family pyridoxamine 5'-phosphate oxidase n=1 Tax=Zavarzinia sp. CC-PAN008 TaxID=3243332 RepID=UPI003F744100